jgi:hypothetical protein
MKDGEKTMSIQKWSIDMMTKDRGRRLESRLMDILRAKYEQQQRYATDSENDRYKMIQDIRSHSFGLAHPAQFVCIGSATPLLSL